MVSGILFDKDGTLFDFHLSWSGFAHDFLTDVAKGDTALAAEMGARIGFDFESRSFTPDSCVIAGTDVDIVAAILPLLPGQAAPDLMTRISRAAALAPMTEAVPLYSLLTELRGLGLRLGVATNDSEHAAKAHLAQTGILNCFDSVVGFDSGHGSKPGPGMCTAFATHFGLDPGDVLMIGDSLHDLHAGHAAGMRPIGVLTGLADAATLAPHAEMVLANIGALPALLAKGGALQMTQSAANAPQTGSESVAI